MHGRIGGVIASDGYPTEQTGFEAAKFEDKSKTLAAGIPIGPSMRTNGSLHETYHSILQHGSRGSAGRFLKPPDRMCSTPICS